MLSVLAARSIHAQELEPRAYSPNPTGINFLVVGGGRSTGGVLFDTSLPVSNVRAELNAASLRYGRTFSLFGRSASAGLEVPYVRGTLSGEVGERRGEIHRSGLADPKLRLSANLVGGPALSPAEFARRTPRTSVGASLVVVPPVGQYDPEKLINLGSNRWAFKPELGVSSPVGRWYLECYAGVWLFTDNDDFFGGARREQDPVFAIQGHVSYLFKPGLWLAFDATHYGGGRTSIDGLPQSSLQSNTRIGLTLSLPVSRQNSLKLAWSDGATTRIGSDFTSVGIAWQYTWFDRQGSL